MKKNFLVAILCLLSGKFFAQTSSTDNSILWKVSGNGLQQPSYLFGTYHFLSNAFVDTRPAVLQAYKSTEAVVGELVIDSSIRSPMMQASILKGTTLQQVLPDTLYAKAADWFKQETGLDILQLNQFNPVAVMTVALQMTQQKYFANKPGEVQLDTYFQNKAKKDGKKVLGLETIDVQIKALFGQLTMPRQIELLNETLKEKAWLRTMIGVMNKAYVSQNMTKLQQLMYEGSYKPEEMKVLLDDRNNNWMQQLPKLMQEQPIFVAVGVLHLVGHTGLVNQLKERGYKVVPVNLKN